VRRRNQTTRKIAFPTTNATTQNWTIIAQFCWK